jgi:ornithine cyclodeaminase/alanine dehydrogenase-like protein (mu-crystallin family)
VRPIRRVYVVTRTGTKDAEFCAHLAQRLGIELVATRHAQFAIEQADVLCTATTSSTPVVNGRWLRPGTHVNAVGAYTAKMRELDTLAVQRSRVYVDHHPAAQTEAGDLLLPIASSDLTYDHVIGTLGELVNGTVPGRRTEEEITLFKSVGLAMQDAVTASRVYQQAVERGIGRQMPL